MKVVLTIAGSDSGGGAGIQADLKTFEAHGVFGTSAITSVTVQNTRGVRRVHDVPYDIVREQILAVLDDFDVSAIKIGMLSNVDVITVVAEVLRERAADIPVVLDPVMVATSGDRLLNEDALEALVGKLLPAATVLTPNVAEAEVLSGFAAQNRQDIRRAAQAILSDGPEHVLLKGGDREEYDEDGKRIALDFFLNSEEERWISGEFVDSSSTHGTGCTLSSAIAARLACGADVLDAVMAAKRYVTDAIRSAPGLGAGHGPLLHRVATDNK